jgi:hypothetical protein
MTTRRLGQELPWPDEWKVTIRDVQGTPYTYDVITWSAEAKAVALAVAHHRRLHPASTWDKPGYIYDLKAERIGPAPSTEKGAMILDGADAIDRAEF